jgi:glycine betaine/proline transport system permease protein
VPFLIVETIAFVQIALGLFGDLAAQARERIASIEGTLELRRQQLQAAIEAQSDKVDVYKRTVASLEDAIGGIGWKRNSWKTRASGSLPAASRCC